MTRHEKPIRDDSGEGYRFCWDKTLGEEVTSNCSPKTLVKRLEKLTIEFEAAGNVDEYEAIRGKYCALNRALNTKEIFAPRFRPTIRSKIQLRATTSRAQNLISNDHQIIDLDWLAINCNTEGEITSRLPDNFKQMMGGLQGTAYTELNESSAEKFVGTGGSPSRKAEEFLALSPGEQLMTRTLQGETTRSKWRSLKGKRDVIEKKLRGIGLEGSQKSWPDAWLARALAEQDYDSTFWYEFITGETIAASTITNIIKRIEKAETR